MVVGWFFLFWLFLKQCPSSYMHSCRDILTLESVTFVLQIPILDLNLIPIRRMLALVVMLLEATVTRMMTERQ